MSVAPAVSSAGPAAAEPATESREIAVAHSPFVAALAAAMLGVPPRSQPPAVQSAAQAQADPSSEASAAESGADALGELEAGAESESAGGSAALDGAMSPRAAGVLPGGQQAESLGAASDRADAQAAAGASAFGTAAEPASARSSEAGAGAAEARAADAGRSAGRGRIRGEDTSRDSDQPSEAATRDAATLALLQAAYLTYSAAPGAADTQPGSGSASGQAAAGAGGLRVPSEKPGAAANIAVPDMPQGAATAPPEGGQRDVAAEAPTSADALATETAPWREDAAQRRDMNTLARAARAAADTDSHARATVLEQPVSPVSAGGTRDDRENSNHAGAERRPAMATELSGAVLAHGGPTPPPSFAAELASGAAPEPASAPRIADESAQPACLPMDRITLQLPDDVGGARIHVAVRAGSVAARIVTPDAGLGRRLEAGLGELQAALARRGFDEVKLAVPASRAAVPAGAEAAAMLPAASTGASEPEGARQHSSSGAERQPSREDGATPFGGRQHPSRQQQRSRRERER
ncbi:MAG TPA: hypothetical protein VFS11_01860 [Gemmatimonadales bacterium]|nr:hypothetical protein [Gemmatimonadales bacterium]